MHVHYTYARNKTHEALECNTHTAVYIFIRMHVQELRIYTYACTRAFCQLYLLADAAAQAAGGRSRAIAESVPQANGQRATAPVARVATCHLHYGAGAASRSAAIRPWRRCQVVLPLQPEEAPPQCPRTVVSWHRAVRHRPMALPDVGPRRSC